MSDKKPFWEGKTCKELDGLHVKITWNNGDTMTSTLNIFGNAGQCELSPARHPAATFAPYADIESIELVDDPEYERIEEAGELQENDIATMLDGNRYKVTAVEKDRNRFWGRVYGAVGQECIALGSDAFDYGLRPKLQLPDHNGLWLDKDGNTWMMRDGSVQCMRIGAGTWCFTRSWFSQDSVQVRDSAPFRPAKAVEA